MSWTALADLARDIGGELPAEAFDRWRDPAARSDDLAARILAPFEKRGTVVCSDTAGLSKMASALPLAVVLRRIGEPKERIHAAGTGLGGRAIGRWVADNTEMFYPWEVPVDAIVRAMVHVHDEGPVQVGFCIHSGVFYEIGGGLYGPDADRVEILAEEHSAGGETLVTPEARARLGDLSAFRLDEREQPGFGVVFAVGTDLPAPEVRGSPDYPLPYDDGMHDLLAALDESAPGPGIARIDERYLAERTVMLVQRHQSRPVRNRVATVQALLDDVSFQQLVQPVLAEDAGHWTVGGSIALASFAHAADAVRTARRLRALAAAEGLVLTLGIDAGSVYLFPMAGGRHEFAGDPVNRASKMAEDLAEPGSISVSARAAAAVQLDDARPVTWSISGIEIDARVIEPPRALDP